MKELLLNRPSSKKSETNLGFFTVSFLNKEFEKSKENLSFLLDSSTRIQESSRKDSSSIESLFILSCQFRLGDGQNVNIRGLFYSKHFEIA